MKTKLTFLFLSLLLSFSAFSQSPLTDSLIAYYPYNGNANDASGNGNNGTVYGATLTADRFGNANSAYYFNGTSDYIRFTPNSKFQPVTFPFSMTAWIKLAPVSGVATIFSNNLSPYVYAGIELDINPDYGGVVGFSYRNGGPPTAASRRGEVGSKIVDDNQWHFVAAVVRGYSDMDIYVDCNYDLGAIYLGTAASIFYNADSSGSSGMNIYNYTQSFYQGTIDEIRFYHRNLTQTDLQKIYSYPKPFDGLSVTLPKDTSVCANAVLVLAPSITGSVQGYVWSNGSTTSSIQPNQSGAYSVQVFNGCSYAADTTQVTFQNCTGVEQVNPNNSFSLFYVADNNLVTIQNLAVNQSDLVISLYNALGQQILTGSLIKTGGQPVYQYPLPNNLPSGIYFVNVLAGDINKSLKVVR